MPDLAAPLIFRNRIYSSDYGATTIANTVDAAMSQIGKRIGGGWYSVREFGAVGDGIADDTAAIQAALDGAMGTLYFPPGVYKVSGSGAACLTLTKNIDIVGCNGRMAYIRATAGTNTTSILRVSFSENWGFGNVRNWRFANLSMNDATAWEQAQLAQGELDELREGCVASEEAVRALPTPPSCAEITATRWSSPSRPAGTSEPFRPMRSTPSSPWG